jgi:acetyl/propionyl-CoA carboxylase alpha subunit
VEHPVTELVYAVDLVREQLRIAGGLPMTVSEWPLAPRGHAIECRITSEDPANGFLPSTGRITYLRAPAGPGVRWDCGVEAGDEVSRHYDSLLAKLVVHGADRAAAIGRMERALGELIILGVATNQAFLRRLLADREYRSGRMDIQFLERRTDLLAPEDGGDDLRLAIAAALAEEEHRQSRKPSVAGPDAGPTPWTEAGRRDALR